MFKSGKDDHSVVLACFSPTVMILTFFIEFSLALYTFIKYKLSETGRVILALILCLGFFQIAEYFVCTQSSVAYNMARFGYASITFLPPLGFYLMSLLSKPLPKKLVRLMFAVTLLIVVYFLSAQKAFDGYTCTGNYVIFQIGTSQFYIYSLFYFGLLATSLWKGARFIVSEAAAKAKLAVKWLIAGYLVFIVPVAVLVVAHPDTRAAVPSIMCGFAIGLAVILAARVAPLSLKKR